jgi:hypothetical protein
MTDVELARALERGEVSDFHHASHLHVAWAYLAESASAEQAANKMSQTLRRLAAGAGKPQKYHETMTLFWIKLLAHAYALNRDRCLKEVVRANPQLLEKNLPLNYYSRERLFSDEARLCWVQPDLKPLSIDATATCPPSSPRHAPDRSLS